ncbi:putative TonB-dependent siderophore receptor [Candidatus Filomicrobium marinum]|uniref:Putative TonB-dependent siderophore receptor n=1 Tax=Candidatus Filomicrobium marinum TaxID=1608628 RepID=A0A0D6JHX8_9HYPH|nr:TonB-dependent receptor [Candidatus Filomicrobium marinum]CFX45327.1 putative TonB-dependent siderophore receptor [Candidatus Filomicrobium marinum]CPR20774.1 putative TonB-dependent siderophore receptor [Candidatus Filomicrobium marinum]
MSNVLGIPSLHASRLSLLALAVVAPGFAGKAMSQTAPAANEAVELPTIEVTTQQTSSANPKQKKPQAGATAVSQPIPTTLAETASASTGQGETKPGLNLDAPAATGSRLGLTPLETPASVEIIPAQSIRERGQQSVTEAVTQNATGFTSAAAPGNGGSSLTARGFVGHGSVMQLYDGTRLYVGSGTVSFPFDTWSAERIEVLRGPASVLYGEGAIGGVVNVVPKKPTDYFTHEAEIAIGTEATKRFGIGSGGPISDSLAYRFDASGIKSDGWLDDEGDFSSIAVSGALRWRPTSDLSFTVSQDYGDQSPLRYWGTPLINGTVPDSIRFKSYNVRDSDVHYRDNWTQFKTEWKPADWIELSNTAYRLTSNRHWRNVESYAYNAGRIDRSSYIEIFHDQEQIGNRLDATVRTALPGGVKNEMVVGFDVNRIDFRHTNNSPYSGASDVDPFNPHPGWFINTDGTRPKFDTETSQYALFAEDRLKLSNQLSLVAGIRLDRPTMERHDLITGERFTKEFSNVTWRAGAVYSPLPGLAFYGQYATGVDPIGGLITLSKSNAEYDLATGRQIEIGVKQSFWNGRGEWTLAGYDIEKKNLLSRDPDNPDIVQQVGRQSSRGVEASLALQLTDTLRYEGNVALLEARYDEYIGSGGINYAGKRPRNVPEQVINSWLTWAFLPDWEARIGAQWVGSIYSDDANLVERPDFTVVNLGLDYHVTEKSAVSLRVFNVFDEVYTTGGSTTEWQLAPPRSAELSYRIKY